MKKTTLGIITTALFAQQAFAAELYNQDNTSLAIGGRVEARADFKNDEDKTEPGDRTVNDSSRARVNFDGKTQIGEYNVGGFAEMEMNRDGFKELRHAYVSVSNETTEIRYGKTSGALGQVTDFTDFYDSVGGQAQGKLKTADRADNQLLVTSQVNDNALQVNLNAGGQEFESKFLDDDDHATTRFGIGISAIHLPETGFAMGLGIALEEVDYDINSVKDSTKSTRSTLTKKHNDTALDKSKGQHVHTSGKHVYGSGKHVYGSGKDVANNVAPLHYAYNDAGKGKVAEAVLSIGYTQDNYYFGAGVNNTKVMLGDLDEDQTGFEFVGKYNIEDNWDVKLGYQTLTYSDGSDNDSYVTGESAYKFSENMLAYIGVEYGLAGEPEDSIFTRIGGKYTF